VVIALFASTSGSFAVYGVFIDSGWGEKPEIGTFGADFRLAEG
jgi:hypothetical protein